MLQPIQIYDEKLICPVCKKEVQEYPPGNMQQGEYTCLNCNSRIRFYKHEDKYHSWVTGQF